MSDRMCGCITIGGQLDRGNLPVLLRAITESGVSLEWGHTHFVPADAEELLVAREDERLWLCDDQAAFGVLTELEATCQALGLAFRRHSEGNDEHDAEIADWRPGMPEPLARPGSNSNEQAVFVPLDRVVEALDHLAAGRTSDALEVLRNLCPSVPAVPPFHIA